MSQDPKLKPHRALEEPVHAILVKPALYEQLAQEGILPKDVLREKMPLPQEQRERPGKKQLTVLKDVRRFQNTLPSAKEMRRQKNIQAKLTAVYEHLPKPDPTPPCDTCVTTPCCVAFVVYISKIEYESGLFGDYAIKIEEKHHKQLRGRLMALNVLSGPNILAKADQYVLEGVAGQPCPFLGEDNKCGIYHSRPAVCRTYTCVGDERITPGMRAGTEHMPTISEFWEGRLASK